MGSHDHPGHDAPDRTCSAPTAGSGRCFNVASPGRLGRPLTFFRMPGLEKIDQFYYTTENVDRRTISRFYGYTLEDPGPGALRQFAPYLRHGHMLSADGRIDYSARLGEITVPTLMVAGRARPDLGRAVDPDDLRCTGQPDKTLVVFGKSNGHIADYGHCDLAWSRYAPQGDLPGHDRLARSPPAGRPAVAPEPAPVRSRPSPSSQEGVDADL